MFYSNCRIISSNGVCIVKVSRHLQPSDMFLFEQLLKLPLDLLLPTVRKGPELKLCEKQLLLLQIGQVGD